MNSLSAMREAVFFEGDAAPRKTSRFWLLLALSAIIASAGVVGDSTATVIGAMIVAPLMTPILGVVLATVLGDRSNVLRSWLFVLGGAAAAVTIGCLVGMIVPTPVVAASNAQVAARVSPHLIDLLAALATGVVGAVALVRKDISDTLPGVAIAISLVPPLTVVGLTAESGAWSQALGALLLFGTNVAAILASGVVVLLLYRVPVPTPAAAEPDAGAPRRRLRPLVTIGVAVLIIGIPLTATSVSITRQTLETSSVSGVVNPWAQQNGWEIVAVTESADGVEVRLTGKPPVPGTHELTDELTRAGVDPARVRLEFVPAYEISLGNAP